MPLPPKNEFADPLLRWFASAMRPLPWRGTYDPYSVWISEIMLQQTQMERGVRYFNAWMRRFPDIRSVAEAEEEAILAAWEGLGYYSRARNLHAAARRVMAEHAGVFPRDPEAIRALPGVGEYTAAAIAAIAFNLPEAAVDANVLRIFARICDIDAPVSGKAVRAFVAGAVRSLMPADSPRLFVQALMEFGALVCGKVPKCGECPLARLCAARRLGTVPDRPRKGGKAGYTALETTAGILLRGDLVFIRKRPPDGLWAGLWEFPGGSLGPGEDPERAAVRHAGEASGMTVAVREKIAVVRHGYTTFRVTMHGYLCGVSGDAPSARSEAEGVWIPRGEIGRYAFPAGQRKLLERLGWKKSTVPETASPRRTHPGNPPAPKVRCT